MLGAADKTYLGWLSTDKDSINMSVRNDFIKYWSPGSRSSFHAEHVLEHLNEAELLKTLENCFEFLKKGGRFRIAVPDGYHPDASYIEYVRPGGTGSGAKDHKRLFNYKTLNEYLRKIGFNTILLEYWDENGQFHFVDWKPEDGFVLRSKRFDPRNSNCELNFTSLIVDAVKP